ncbi:MAG: hypothetical protein AVDCRST_MAG04-1517, partial [uncultured Acetobacteraceae bacterium]
WTGGAPALLSNRTPRISGTKKLHCVCQRPTTPFVRRARRQAS